ncbi:O-antigen ligase family protein [Dyella monticola]|uniref:O-antigen ligase family protein n=1 Tax=Dyella monticola TaxID=1927958 RepID=A0A370WVQ8_9GAMM|nr:O-antigen ligase family protein [Dyella monticola]RDS80126.1 O-antigen ligase family protein [Dyella monticola]
MRSSVKSLLRSPLLPLWLLVFLLPFGRSAEAATCLCVVGLIVVWWRHTAAPWNEPSGRLLMALLACYIGAALLSAFAAVAPGKSWGTVLALLRYVPLGLYACYALRGERRVQGFYRAVAIVIAWWVLDAWMQMLTGWSLRGHAEPERISGLFGADDPKLGPTLAVLSPFALWAARWRWGWRGLVAAFVLVLGPVLLSGSRSAWICFGLVMLAFIWREARSLKRFVAVCVAAAAVLLIAGGIAWKTSTRFDARMQRTLLALGGNEQAINEATTGRLDIWYTSAAMIQAHPVTGVGVRGFRYAYPHYAPSNDHFLTAENCGEGEGACHAHQLVLEVLTETGVIGALLWLLGVVIACVAWRRTGAVGRSIAFPVTVSLGVMVFPFNSHLAFYSAWWGLLFAWLLGLWCAVLFGASEELNDGA